jgi:hypothetical protein
MKRMIAILVTLVFTLSFAVAEDTEKVHWKNGGQGALQFSQAALKNWTAGGDNALSLNVLFNYFINYQIEKMTWENILDVGYGLQFRSGVSQKTDDRIDMSSTFAYQAAKNWDYSGMLSFKTQMTKGYADTVVISSLMAPAYVLVSAGMKYAPGENFSVLLSPLTGKMTVIADPVLSAAGSFGVDAGSSLRAELGGFIKISFKTELMKNVNLNTKCELFSNYFNNPQFIDVNWDLMLAMKINEYLSANLSTQLIYDHDIDIEHETADGSLVTGPAVQFKEMFTFGLSYSF